MLSSSRISTRSCALCTSWETGASKDWAMSSIEGKEYCMQYSSLYFLHSSSVVPMRSEADETEFCIWKCPVTSFIAVRRLPSGDCLRAVRRLPSRGCLPAVRTIMWEAAVVRRLPAFQSV